MAHWKAGQPIERVEIADGLFRISAPAGSETQHHSYFLVRSEGNILFGPPDRLPFYKDTEQAGFFDGYGGIGIQALTHGGDASKACALVAEKWGAAVHVNAWELAEARHASGLAIESGFANDVELAPGVEGIHLPGHAVGFTAFRFTAGAHSYLVSGHTLKPMPTRDRWTIHTQAPLAEASVGSLERLRTLAVDFLLPDLTRWGTPPPLAFGAAQRPGMVASAIEQVRKKFPLG